MNNKKLKEYKIEELIPESFSPDKMKGLNDEK